MDLNTDFKFGPQPPLAPFTKDPQAAPTPSAGIWAPQPHPPPINQVLNPPVPQPVIPASSLPHPAGSPPGVQSLGQPPSPVLPKQEAIPASVFPRSPIPGTPTAHPPLIIPPNQAQPGPLQPNQPGVMSPAEPIPVIPIAHPNSVQPALTPMAPPSPPTAAVPSGVNTATATQSASDLGLLAPLLGKWRGSGFNIIWRPNNSTGSDHFLELNLTDETLEFMEIPGDIPNRGLRQGDISMRGMHYLQQIQDVNTRQGLHLETGIWAIVPATVNPLEPETVVRMASIPHGASMLAQGTSSSETAGPIISPVSIAPFQIAAPTSGMTFGETNLSVPTTFRSPPAQLVGVTQGMVDNPNSVLTAALSGQTIKTTTQLNISTQPVPVIGGGVANTAFLLGGSSGPNAQAVQVTASFWLEVVKGGGGAPDILQLQYSQTVMLNFAGLSWPHVSVATLKKV